LACHETTRAFWQWTTLLGINDKHLSEVMHGKRKINMELAKQLYNTLGVDQKSILEKS